MLLQCIRDLLNPSFAVDLGTANTLVHIAGRGVVVNEPSCIAIQISDHNERRVIAVGSEAKSMLGRTPERVNTIRPIRDGVIADFKAAEALVRALLEQSQRSGSMVKPRVAVCVPSNITEVEKRAVCESFERAGGSGIHLFAESLAAAVGAGLPVGEASGSMVVDIGGGTTEVAVISLNGVVQCESIRIAGDKFDETIVNYLKKSHKILVGEQTAERAKIEIGAAMSTKEPRRMKINGRDLASALPKTVEITEEEIVNAIQEPLEEVINVIRRVLEGTPPELVGDIAERGVTLVGGGALIRNLDTLISQEVGLPVMIAEDPMTCCVTGCGTMLRELGRFPELPA